MSVAIAARRPPLTPRSNRADCPPGNTAISSGAISVKTPEESKPPTQVGHRAEAHGHELHSYRVGLLPIVNRILKRLRLEEFFRAYLPPQDRRCRIDPATGLKTSSFAASHSTASARGPRDTTPTSSASPKGKSRRSMTIASEGASTDSSRTIAGPSP